MAVEAPVVIYEVGRIRYDDVGATVDAHKHVAEHCFCRWHIVNDRIDRAEGERFAVDVAEHNPCLLAKKFACDNSSCAATAPDIDEFYRPARNVYELSAQQSDKSIGIGS